VNTADDLIKNLHYNSHTYQPALGSNSSTAVLQYGNGEIFDDCFIANFPGSVPVKEFCKSVEN